MPVVGFAIDFKYESDCGTDDDPAVSRSRAVRIGDVGSTVQADCISYSTAQITTGFISIDQIRFCTNSQTLERYFSIHANILHQVRLALGLAITDRDNKQTCKKQICWLSPTSTQ